LKSVSCYRDFRSLLFERPFWGQKIKKDSVNSVFSDLTNRSLCAQSKIFPVFFPVLPPRQKFERTGRPIKNSDLQFEAELEVAIPTVETGGRRAQDFPDSDVS
jgi:hypothetical protein